VGAHEARAGADPAADDQLLPSPDPDPARPAEEGAQRGGVAGAAAILAAGSDSRWRLGFRARLYHSGAFSCGGLLLGVALREAGRRGGG
jgi:hypothetical protein